MNTKHRLGSTVAILSLALGTSVAIAQQSGQPARSAQPQNQSGQAAGTQPKQQQAQAEKCLRELQAFSDRTVEDGYWVAGWGSRGYGTAATPATSNNNATQSDAGARTGAADKTGTAPPGQAQQAVRPPDRRAWYAEGWGIRSAPYQIRSLQAAANVLGHRGEQEGCSMVLAELREVYAGHVDRMKQMGLQPGESITWRQRSLLEARPITEIRPDLINLGDLIGTEVRNRQDEQLGTIEDAVVDQKSGDIGYVIMSSGGILGIGEDMVAVPWKALHATAGLNTLVLNVSEEVIEQAPTASAAEFSDQNGSMKLRQEVDQFWQKHAG